ncbi:MAG: 3-deoxy-7-phosphoheptulonate synthase [Acidobacteriota bacterium]
MLAVMERDKMKVARRLSGGNIEVNVGGHIVGANNLTVIAGPCAVEGEEMLRETAVLVKKTGAHMLRGGAFKPRTSPYSFQGLGLEGLEILNRVSLEMNIPVVTEVLDAGDVDLVAEYVDVLQVGARNMQNFALLRKLGKISKPIILKRGISATIEEWLLAAEYILDGGNNQVILCERGIRTHEPWTRNTLDLSAVAIAKEISCLPVIVDPSHATGHDVLVMPMAKAAIAAGADGIMVEVHPKPELAMSDGAQSLTPAKFRHLMLEIRNIAWAVGRS